MWQQHEGETGSAIIWMSVFIFALFSFVLVHETSIRYGVEMEIEDLEIDGERERVEGE